MINVNIAGYGRAYGWQPKSNLKSDFSMRHTYVRSVIIAVITLVGYGLNQATASPLAQEEAKQQQPDGVLAALEEVTVTAERRSEAEQSVPMAITALSEGMLERQQIRSVAQLGEVVPNFYIAPNTGTSSAAKIFMRGIGEAESFFTADPPVGMYIDDIYIARQTGAIFDLFDIERLEVLRGPQGTLYGRNSSAGAVKLVSKRPVIGEHQGQVEVAFGRFNSTSLRASGSIPIGATAALQGAVLVRERDGWTKNLATGRDVNDQDVKGARLSLLMEPTERFRALVVADYVRERSTPGYAVPLVLDTSIGDPVLGPEAKTGDFFVTNSDLEQPVNDLDHWGVSTTLEFDVNEDLTLKAIASHRVLENELYLDADGDTYQPLPSRASLYHVYQNQEQYQSSLELQALGKLMDSRLSYVAGIYTFREHNDQDSISVLGLPALYGLPVASAGRIDLTNIARESMTTDSYAAFVTGTLHLTDRLSFTTGLRYTSEKKDFSNDVILPNGTAHIACLNQTVTPAVQIRAAPCTATDLALGYSDFINKGAFDKTWTAWTPRFVIDFKLNDSAMTYVSAAKGFKGGTTNGRDVAALRNLYRLIGDMETNWSYEAGLKADWFDRRLRTNVAAFRNEYRGLQASLTTPEGGYGRINSGDVRINGLEFELAGVPVRGLELTANIGLLDAKYTAWDAALSSCAVYGIDTIPEYLAMPLKVMPDWQYRIGANYSYDTGSRGVFSVGADFNERDEYFNNVCATPGIATTNYEFLNAQLRWESPSGRTLVTLNGSNLTDSEVISGAFDFGRSLGFASTWMYPPRMWMLSVRHRL